MGEDSLTALGEDAGCEAEGGVVCPPDDLLLGVELQAGGHAAEDLLLHEPHVVAAVGDHGGREVPAGAALVT